MDNDTMLARLHIPATVSLWLPWHHSLYIRDKCCSTWRHNCATVHTASHPVSSVSCASLAAVGGPSRWVSLHNPLLPNATKCNSRQVHVRAAPIVVQLARGADAIVLRLCVGALEQLCCDVLPSEQIVQ